MQTGWFTSKKRVKDAVQYAVSEYQQAIEQEGVGHHRDAYMWYLKAQTAFSEVEECYGTNLNKEYKYVVSTHLNNISSRLPTCATLAAEEMIKVTKKLHQKKREGDLAAYKQTQHDIITNFDRNLFVKPLTDKQKGLFPNADEEDYTDDSDTEEIDYNITNVEDLLKANEAYERNKAPTKNQQGSAIKPGDLLASQVKVRRPQRPRVLTEKFKQMMQQKQPWDELKPMVYTHLLRVKWSDVIGYEKTKRFLNDNFIYSAKQETMERDLVYGSHLEKPNRTCLLYGPPGTGKTQLAEAAGTEATGHVFIRVQASQIVDKYVGESERKMTLLFTMARDLSPAIIFFDECEAMFASRTDNASQSSSNLTATLLSLMSMYHEIYLIATTNLPWSLDPAFLRRFSNLELLDLPTITEREVMLKYVLSTLFIMITEIEYAQLAKLTDGYSGADLQMIARKINDLQKSEQVSARFFKFCPYRKDKIIPCLSTDPDVSKVKSRWFNYRAYDLDSPLLGYKEVKEVIKSHGRKTVNEEMLKQLREYAKNPAAGDPGKKKKKEIQYVYVNNPNPAGQQPQQYPVM